LASQGNECPVHRIVVCPHSPCPLPQIYPSARPQAMAIGGNARTVLSQHATGVMASRRALDVLDLPLYGERDRSFRRQLVCVAVLAGS